MMTHILPSITMHLPFLKSAVEIGTFETFTFRISYTDLSVAALPNRLQGHEFVGRLREHPVAIPGDHTEILDADSEA